MLLEEAACDHGTSPLMTSQITDQDYRHSEPHAEQPIHLMVDKNQTI